MPASQVFKKFKAGALHSGSKSGPLVKSRAQATAIYLSEKKKGDAGDPEYTDPQPHQTQRSQSASIANSAGSQVVKRALRGAKPARPAIFGRNVKSTY